MSTHGYITPIIYIDPNGESWALIGAIAVLRNLGISFNNAMNGVYLPASMHTGLHTAEYYNYIDLVMKDVTSYSEFTEAVRKIIEWIVSK